MSRIYFGRTEVFSTGAMMIGTTTGHPRLLFDCAFLPRFAGNRLHNQHRLGNAQVALVRSTVCKLGVLPQFFEPGFLLLARPFEKRDRPPSRNDRVAVFPR
jgi:hypothetical protein